MHKPSIKLISDLCYTMTYAPCCSTEGDAPIVTYVLISKLE